MSVYNYITVYVYERIKFFFCILNKSEESSLSNLFWERFYNMCVKNGTKPNPVAKEINISSGIVTRWKIEGTLPNGETLIKIANYLNCSVDYLLGRTDNPDINK